MSMLFVRESVWLTVRETFSLDEKLILSEATVGDVICPRGWTIDETAVRPALLQKLKDQIGGAR